MLPLFSQPASPVAGGFRSALPLLGLSAPSVTIQAGYRSMMWRWGGGASATPVTVQGGYRSLLAFWAGGAFSGTAIPPIPPVTPVYEGHSKEWIRDRTSRLQADDEFVALFLASFTATAKR
jgi:hypothetical protein